MKKILITICTLFACVMLSVAQGDSYRITGQVGNSVNGKLLLVALTEKGLIDIGEAVITNGAFEFTGRMSETTLAYLMPVQRNAALATIMLENANYTITAGTNELLVEGGGEAQRILKEFNDLEKYLIQSGQQLQAQAKANPAQAQKLRENFKKIITQVETEELALLNKYSDTYVAAYVVYAKLSQSFDETKLEERYNILGEKAKATIYGKQIAAELKKIQKLAIGAIAPDFTAPLSDGGVLSLHETKAKVKVVDFWASWCIPCIQEVPLLKKLQEKYKNQGLQIVGVSVDSDREKWQGALDKHQPEGIQISELKGWESTARVDYGVQAIPFTVLIDASGKILARNPHGPLLEEIIEKYFSQK